MLGQVGYAGIIITAVVFFGLLALFVRMYRKARQGESLVRTGLGGTKVAFSGMLIVPVIHKLEIMDIRLKTIVISRTAKDGLICKDNMRADIKVTFFVRVNQTHDDVKQVAQSIGCERASDQDLLESLFDAKFSEALKTVGKRFDFVELYNSRDDFKREILNIIGTDLNGYVLDDCAIDYLEQTPIENLNEQNILDAEGIKKIIQLTAEQKMKANYIEREKEKTIKKQDVEAKETVLELERQQADAEARNMKEISTVRAREQAEIDIVREEERLKAEKARIKTDEELEIADENRRREVVVAEKNKERTEAVESERVQQAQALEATEKERLVELAQIAKEKAIEEEKKNIQDVIRDRVAIQKTVVEEEEKTKDIQAFAEAERLKQVAITGAEKDAEAALVKKIKDAEAAKQASEHIAKQKLIDAQADENAASHMAQAKKTLAEAQAAEAASIGMSEAQVMEAKAAALEKEGEAEATVIEAKADAEAKGIRAKGLAQAEADEKLGDVAASVSLGQGEADAKVIELKAVAEEKRGLAEANVLKEKLASEADGIREKAEAMKSLDGESRAHEEFRLALDKEKEIELARISIQSQIAESQAKVIAEALQAANIDIVGGETMFFDQIVGSIAKSKSVDRLIGDSEVLTQVKDTFFGTETGDNFKDKLRSFVGQFGISAEEIRDLSVSALLVKLGGLTNDTGTKDILRRLKSAARALNILDSPADSLLS